MISKLCASVTRWQKRSHKTEKLMTQQQRTYEVMFIVRPDLPEEETERVVSTVESSATTAGITVKNVERMGKRRLAYKVRKFQDGVYVLLTVEGPGRAVAELERRLRVTEPVLKYITVRIDEEQKRLAKIKKIRESKVRQHPHAAESATGTEPAPVTA
jgi:small subunit ribosomal protein S6